MVEELSEAKIPVIKAEILHDVDICLKTNLSEFYYSASRENMIEENYREVIERKIVSLESRLKILEERIDNLLVIVPRSNNSYYFTTNKLEISRDKENNFELTGTIHCNNNFLQHTNTGGYFGTLSICYNLKITDKCYEIF